MSAFLGFLFWEEKDKNQENGGGGGCRRRRVLKFMFLLKGSRLPLLFLIPSPLPSYDIFNV